jgi:hypothetical protein
MLTRIYVEALLANKDLDNQVSVLWNAAVITDAEATGAWLVLASMGP